MKKAMVEDKQTIHGRRGVVRNQKGFYGKIDVTDVLD